MNTSSTVCPVCTLYLREGVTLQAHLETHPKDQVIEALLKLSNVGSSGQVSQASTTTTSTASFGPVQSFANSSNTAFLSQTSPYINPQTQMTTAVTYQHFMTSNGSTIMPQYIQVPTIINPSTNVPVVSNQTVDYVPSQTINYSQTMYNPLYNPYIPHPYPFTQPIYTSYPMATLPAVDSSIQTNQIPNSSVPSTQVGTALQPSVIVEKCSVATNTEIDKSNSKDFGTKKSVTKLATLSKKVKLIKQKVSDSSSSRFIIKGTARSSTGTVTKFGCSKRSVIRTLRPKKTSGSSLGTSSGMISPPPLTPKTGTPKRSIRGTKTPTPPPLTKAPSYISDLMTFIKKENVAGCNEQNNSTLQLNESLNQETYLVQNNPNTVIVDSTTLIQTKNNETRNFNKNFEVNENQVQTVDLLADKEIESESNRILQSNESEVNDGELEEYNGEVENIEQEKVFQMIEVIESKIDISEVGLNEEALQMDISNKAKVQEEIDQCCETSDAQKENEEVYSTVVESEGECQTSNHHNFYNKNTNETSIISESVTEDNIQKVSDLQPVTYTDLQPAKSSRIFQDLGLAASINFNNFMEVDGIKIFFNNPASTIPFDPLVKVTTGIQSDRRNITAYMKTENQVHKHSVVDSVIQLVSGNTESKSELTFGDNYTPTTSQVNDIQMDLPNLSPLALNIQADESMPARGELSEQESLGAENSTWNLFHGNHANSARTQEDWKNDNTQIISVYKRKKTTKSFKCSICGEIFSCPKERRVHKNTVHAGKNSKTNKVLFVAKKSKTYICSFCSEVFSSLRDRKTHVAEKHQMKEKNKKSTHIKEEKAEPEYISIDQTDSSIKNETEQQNVKTEALLSSTERDSHRVKYCSKCSLPFIGVKKLREHLRVVHGEIRFKCETCSASFDEELEYNEHLLVHPLVCDKCGKTFHKKANLNLHMKRHLEVKPYECTLCPKSFITRQKLEEHMNGHSGKKPLKCNLCDKTFSRHSNLIQHRNLHHLNVKKKIKDFVCRCGEVFHSLRKLEWHKEIHEPKPKPCPFCSQKFIHSASVTRHIRRAHLPDYLPGDNREFDNVQCPICEKVYLRSSLMVHMRVHNGEKPFSCKICNKRFSTKWNLELHSWTHQSRSNMPFKCQICKSAFFRETDFIAHLNSHRNYKPYTCNICGQKFIRKYSCLRHQDEHKKSKQFICAVNGCAKSFHRGYYLRDHMKVHTGVRPHTCHICGKASSTKSNHNKHVRIHDTREPVNTEN